MANNGFRCFGVACTSHQISRQRYFRLPQCFRYYQYTHSTQKCIRQQQRCSSCAEKHHCRFCQATYKRCLLSGEARTAVSPDCTVRKVEIQKMIEARLPTVTPKLKAFNIQAAAFPGLPIRGATSGAPHNYWKSNTHGSSQPQTQTTLPNQASQSSTQPSPRSPTTPPIIDSNLAALIHFVKKFSGRAIRLQDKTLNKLYEENKLPNFKISKIMFTRYSAPPEASTPPDQPSNTSSASAN